MGNTFDYFENPNNDRIDFTQLALSLASDYLSVYYLNMKTLHYCEYSIVDGGQDMKVLSSGDDFFADTKINCRKLVYKDDQENFLRKINRETFEQVFASGESFTLDYRLVIDGVPTHFHLKTIKNCQPGDNHLLVAVRNVEKEFRARQRENRAAEIYNHIATALAGRYEAIYYVDIITDVYSEYASSEKYAKLDVAVEGTDFFDETARNMEQEIFPDDLPMMRSLMEKDHFLTMLEKDSIISITYRLLIDGNPEYMNLRAIMPENDNRHVIIAVSNIDSSVRRESELKTALVLANKDALTGVKNKHSYLTLTDEIDSQIREKSDVAFSVVVCDINNLKQINDKLGHIAGDSHIKEACQIICCIYKHSPVFRVGGDEFVVLLRGSDYEHREELFDQIRTTVLENKATDGPIIATGMSDFDPASDSEVNDVFRRADKAMYNNKTELKK